MDNNKGYIRLSREFLSYLRGQAHPVSACEACLMLLGMARFEAAPLKKSWSGGREITLRQGQLIASVRYLANIFGWSERQTRTMIGKWRREGVIKTENAGGITVITVCRFAVFSEEILTNDTANDTANDTGFALSDSELQEKATQQTTQQATQPPKTDRKSPKKRQATDTSIKNVEERSIIYPSSLSPKEDSPCGESKKTGFSSPPPQEERIDWDRFREYYNALFAGKLPQIRAVTESRKAAVRARAKQYGRDSLQEAMRKVAESPFLLGDNGRGWRADFDWMFKQENFTKILEGNYDRRTDNSRAGSAENAGRLRSLAEQILRRAAGEDG